MSMSDDDRDIDIESDDDGDSDNGLGSSRNTSTANFTQAEKRAHHNALERRRRDHIKESFTNLREAVPTLKGEKASRAQILKKTTECIQTLRRKINESEKDIDDIRKQNKILEEQIQRLEGPSSNGIDFLSGDDLSSDAADVVEQSDFSRRSKKIKTFHA
ncbi:hypothetical protein KR222_002202 [Zaprionus bogoriensis]|nr:hypothetical protein KR222_002202 [Zaprionus bogoriensis]